MNRGLVRAGGDFPAAGAESTLPGARGSVSLAAWPRKPPSSPAHRAGSARAPAPGLARPAGGGGTHHAGAAGGRGGRGGGGGGRRAGKRVLAPRAWGRNRGRGHGGRGPKPLSPVSAT